jgi:alkylhydroperoxidase family enzyme
VLPLLYPDLETREALLSDPASAPIPQLHREAFGFAERFVCASSTTTAQDLQRLRDVGLADRDIVQWATLGSTQSWFTMSADGGGIPLEGDAMTGPGVGKERSAYEAAPAGLHAGRKSSVNSPKHPSREEAISFVATEESGEEYDEAAIWAERRYGFVPNLFRAVSLQPGFYPRHRLAFELLEAPQSKSLPPRQHAMVRVLASHLTCGRYSEATAAELLLRVADGEDLAGRLKNAASAGRPKDIAGSRDAVGSKHAVSSKNAVSSKRDALDSEWSPEDRAVLTLATKFASNAYKVTEKDAIGLREVGLDDEAYVDILNTVSIQISLDRLANVLGVRPDSAPLLPNQ